MKPLLTLLASASLALSQTDSKINLGGMTPESLNHLFNDTAMKHGGPVLRLKLVAEAIELKRMDLIKTCFTNPYTVGDALQSIADLPDGEVRRKAAIMMLRTPSATCWPSEKLLIVMSGVAATGMIEPFISTVKNLLQTPLTKEMVATQVARAKLADELVAALQAQGVSFTDDEKGLLGIKSATQSAPAVVAPPSQVSPPVPQMPLTAQAPPAAAKPSPDKSTSKNVATLPPYYLWIAGAAATVIALGWLMQKK